MTSYFSHLMGEDHARELAEEARLARLARDAREARAARPGGTRMRRSTARLLMALALRLDGRLSPVPAPLCLSRPRH